MAICASLWLKVRSDPNSCPMFNIAVVLNRTGAWDPIRKKAGDHFPGEDQVARVGNHAVFGP